MNEVNNTLLKANILLGKGQYQVQRADFEKAMKNFSIAAELYKSIEEYEQYVLAIREVISIYGMSSRYAEALRVAEDLAMFCHNNWGDSHILTIRNNAFIGKIYLAQGYCEKAILYFEDCLEKYQFCSTQDTLFEIQVYGDMVVYYGFLGMDEKTLYYAEKILEKEKQRCVGEDNLSPDIILYYSNIGLTYEKLGNIQMAISCYYKAMVIQEQIGEKNILYKASLLTSLAGVLYVELNQFEKANEYLLEALQIQQKMYGEVHRKTREVYSFMGMFCLYQKQYEKSIQYFQKSIEVADKVFGRKVALTAGDILNIGKVYFKQKDYSKAIEKYQESLAIFQQLYGRKHKKLAVNYNLLSATYFELGDFSKALKMNRKSLITNVQSLENFTPLYNSSGYEEQAIDSYELIKTLVLKIKILHGQYLLECEGHYLKQGLDVARLADKCVDYARKNLLNYKDKERLSKLTRELFSIALNICFELIKEKKDKEVYQQQAFFFIEKAKSVTLSAVLTENKAIQYGNIPQELRDKEQQLRGYISHSKSQLFEAEYEENQEKISYYQNSLADYQIAYYELIQQFEKEYPEYYALKYNYEVIDLATTQQELGDDSLLINYYLSEDSLYFFAITSQSVEFLQQRIPADLANTIETCLSSIYTFWINRIMDPPNATPILKKQLENQFSDKTSQLYEVLFLPVLNEVIDKKTSKVRHLIIIPDDVLWYIPFEVLSSNVPPQKHNFKKYHFLLQDYAISYAYSATMLFNSSVQTLEEKPPITRKLLAVAPDFSKAPKDKFSDLRSFRRRGFGVLKHSKDEVNKIVGIFNGKKLLAEQATKNNFVASVSDYQLVHISTHAKADDENPERSVIAFGLEESSMLYAAEIHQLKLNAELLVLSACETGVGKLQKGEGIASIARAFAYAGVKNLCTSLWSVNDHSTAQIMQAFYQYLKEGKTKDEALRLAKLDYIKNSPNQLAHPFFWAAFVLIGDCKPVVQTSNWRSRLYSFFSKK